MTATARAALYTTESGFDRGLEHDPASLMACARHAQQVGFRIVTVVGEDGDDPASGLGGTRLGVLADRLGDGEFEVIVADAGLGRVVTIAATDVIIAKRAPPVRCAIYVRCASASQATLYPLADQWDACEAYAAKQGWETAVVYKDNAVSGAKWSRPSLDAMIAQAERGAFDVVLVKDLDRLSRDVSHLHALFKKMEALGVVVHTVADGRVARLEAAS